MKFHRLTFFASFFLSVLMMLLAFAFDIYHDRYPESFYSIMFLFVSIISLNYLVLQFLFNFHSKKQLQKISTILPDEIISERDEDLSFRTLGEKVSELNQKNASELDTMKEMEKYRKEYMGNVSHEMKTPLFSIQGYVETLMDGGVDNMNIRDKYLERISKSVERLLNIVTDLDMINKYESGEISLNISKFDINSLIREVLDLMDIEIQKKNAKAVLNTTSHQIFVKADKQKISQVLINLVSNAIYYSNRTNALIQVNTGSVKNKVFIEVCDNGMGIKPEALPRIFERFYRVESSRSRREGGSGLGLAIVKHILDAHHENISVESEYLEGTKFSFMLEKAN